jgi:hypothetical protein
MPGITETFEILIGVTVSEGRDYNIRSKHDVTKETTATHEIVDVGGDTHNVQSETSVRIVMEIVADIAQMTRQ